jgi:hypothetical protein
MTKVDLMAELHACWPSIIRKAVQANPSLLKEAQHSEHLTKIECSVLTAIWVQRQAGWSEDNEISVRRQEFKSQYQQYLHRRQMRAQANSSTPISNSFIDLLCQTEILRGCNAGGLDDALPQGNIPRGNFDPSRYSIRSISEKTFDLMLQGACVKYSYKVYPHSCPIHRDGPIAIAALQQAHADMAALLEEETQLTRQLSAIPAQPIDGKFL